MNLPWVYICSPFWNPLPPPSPSHPSGSSQCTSPKHPVSCIEPGLVIHFTYDNLHVSMPFFEIIPPLPSPTESKRLFYTSVSLLLSRIQGYHYHLSKFHIYVLVYCIGVFLSVCQLEQDKGNQSGAKSKPFSIPMALQEMPLHLYYPWPCITARERNPEVAFHHPKGLWH